MHTLVVPANVEACQIDDFPESAKRSGALYVRPVSTLSVTDEELEHLKKNHKDLFAQLIVHSATPTYELRLAVTARKKAAAAKTPKEKKEAAMLADAVKELAAKSKAAKEAAENAEAEAKAAAGADEKKDAPTETQAPDPPHITPVNIPPPPFMPAPGPSGKKDKDQDKSGPKGS